MNSAYVPLNLHSHYSLLEGLPSPAEWVQAAAARGLPALALTDHRLLTGAVEFYTACRKAGVQPLLGLDLELDYPDGSRRVTLLAAGEQGWPNLCRLSSALMLPGDEMPRLSLAVLDAHSTDLIAIAGELGDSSGRRLAALAELFPGRLYRALAVPPGGGQAELIRQAEQARFLKLPFTASPPAYYLLPAHASLQRILAAIRCNVTVGQLAPQDTAPPGAWFLSAEEMRLQYGGIPGALENTLEIAARCTVELPLGLPFYPRVPLPPGLSPQQALRQKAEDGARRLYGRITPAIQQRLDHELEVIAGRGFEPVFLIVEEVLNFARQTGTPYSSRGSAASSLVAHCIGITGPDPLALDLYFERFLNPARSTPPDIDTDLCSRRRDAVIQHVFDVYGAERTAMVGTINRFRPRSAIGDVAKANGLEPTEARALAEALPHAFWSRREGEEEGEHPSPFAELAAAHRDPLHQRIFQQAQALLKLPRHLSVHAGGLVVGPSALSDRVPLMRSGSKGIPITQLDLDTVEALGLVKIDLLGIRGLTVLGDVAGALHSWQRTRYAGPLEVLEDIPSDDPEVSARVERGETIGCFQIESPGMRATLREIHARTPDDLMAALALYRPGPLQGGLRDAFVRRFKGQEAVEHIHPALAPLLADTYGVILYQEQVLRIANQLAGLSLGEADLLRRAMSHFDPGKQMITLREKFIAGAQAHSGVPPETGARVWELMAAFAGYGFPKAHAASYAQVAWRGAWCKTHFPAEFMAAVLANWGGYYSQRVYLSEARRLGLNVRPPHVNHAAGQFSVCYPAGEPLLYMGLDQVRGLTRRTIERIRRLRPFTSLEDFLARVDPRRQEAETLARCGALEGLGSIPALLARITPGGWRAGQPALFELQAEDAADWSVEQKVTAQQEILGVSLEAHPLELLAGKIAAARAVSTLDAAARIGQRVTLAGLRQVSRRTRTANGEWMYFLTLEDLDGLLDVVFFPDAYRRNRAALQGGGPWLISGTVEMDAERGEALLRAERAAPL